MWWWVVNFNHGLMRRGLSIKKHSAPWTHLIDSIFISPWEFQRHIVHVCYTNVMCTMPTMYTLHTLHTSPPWGKLCVVCTPWRKASIARPDLNSHLMEGLHTTPCWRMWWRWKIPVYCKIWCELHVKAYFNETTALPLPLAMTLGLPLPLPLPLPLL